MSDKKDFPDLQTFLVLNMAGLEGEEFEKAANLIANMERSKNKRDKGETNEKD